MKRLLFFLFVLPCGLRAQKHASSDLSFTVLQLNDIYEIAPLRGSDEGGLARVATVRRRLLQGDANTITVLSGDFVSPSLIGTLSYTDPTTRQDRKIAGKQMVDVLNKMGLDYVTFGNHEFDIRLADLQQRIDESAFTWVNGNVYRVTSGGHSPFVKRVAGGEQPIMPYAIRQLSFAGNRTLRVGFIGATISFNKADSIGYEDEVNSFITTYQSIRGQCDVIIGITHLPKEMDSLLASKLPGLSLILGGHEHTHMRIPVGGLTVCKADANDRTVYIHRISWSPASRKVTVRSELKAIDKTIPADPETDQRVQYWLRLADSTLVKMGYTPGQVLMRTTLPLDGREVNVRNGSTNYTRLIADALFYADTTVDVALYNSGSLRVDDQLMDVVTQYDVLRSLPYGGAMVTMKLNGSLLDSILNIGTIDNRNEGGYLQVRNAEHSDNGWLIKGELLQKDRIYTVLLPEFVAQGKEKNLGVLGSFDYSKPTGFHHHRIRNDMRDILIAYMHNYY